MANKIVKIAYVNIMIFPIIVIFNLTFTIFNKTNNIIIGIFFVFISLVLFVLSGLFVYFYLNKLLIMTIKISSMQEKSIKNVIFITIILPAVISLFINMLTSNNFQISNIFNNIFLFFKNTNITMFNLLSYIIIIFFIVFWNGNNAYPSYIFLILGYKMYQITIEKGNVSIV